MRSALAVFVFLYLFAAGVFRGRLLRADEFRAVEWKRDAVRGAGGKEDWTGTIYRIILRLRSGEIVFYREERREEAGEVQEQASGPAGIPGL